MKRYVFLILILLSLNGFSQTKGISFQAVILDPQKQQLPGFDAEKNILSNAAVAIQFTLTNDSNQKLYQEQHQTSTDSYGMINLLIGSGSRTSSAKFDEIVWVGLPKYLTVDIDISGNGNFIFLSKQALTYMPQPMNDETKDALTNLSNKLETLELIPGPQGVPGSDGDPLDLLRVSSNIEPIADNTYSLGTNERRWAGVHVGPGSIYITDISLETNTELTVDNGVLKINGANQLQVGQLKFVDNIIESATSSIDIQIGDLDDNADLVLNRNMVIGLDKGLKFQDNSIQLTAAVNADWNAESGLSQILNKPNLSEGIAGPAGPIGLTGAAGPQGLRGLQGEAGTTGVAGPNGADGAQGLQGETGAAGTNGANGADGTQGLQGIQGETGAIGVAGINGANGADGATGQPGQNGQDGQQGQQGQQGIQGATGQPGQDGQDGQQGQQGIQGATGQAGQNGQDGQQGPQGATGATGAQGAIGPIGPAAAEVSFTTNFSVVSGTEPAGEQATSSYIKNGALVFVTMNFNLSAVSNFGTGQYTVTLPFAPKYDFILSSGYIHSASKGDNYGIHAILSAGSTTAVLFYTANGGKDEPFTNSKPESISTNDYFNLSGSYIAQ